MNMPTFIEVPIQTPNVDTATVWINVDNIISFAEMFDGRAGVTMPDNSFIVLNIPFQEFVRMLRISGCRLLTKGDIDLRGEPGEEGGVN